MTNRSRILIATVLAAAIATPAAAQSFVQDEWTVDSGRYVNGQVPSYGQGYATQAPFRGTRAPHLIEGRSAAPIYGYDAPNGAPSGRDAMVQSLGN